MPLTNFIFQQNTNTHRQKILSLNLACTFYSILTPYTSLSPSLQPTSTPLYPPLNHALTFHIISSRLSSMISQIADYFPLQSTKTNPNQLNYSSFQPQKNQHIMHFNFSTCFSIFSSHFGGQQQPLIAPTSSFISVDSSSL
ncbi:hypothetical protein I3842_07G092100 [Carya illinoinensis]|uniref:Uncharacterized protein n=1 Tax=Carya illinoinensis TaxID=32201 RepID=A0A922JDZ8_CARIL|nr:hypothetical protein I3842_07G092100 [Carya illinoinensis]